MRTITPATKLTAIIGQPVEHSMSPILHNAIYKKEGIDAVMLAFGNPSVAELVKTIRALPIHLAAVTMPHKQTIMPLLDEIDDIARDIGAVNTVVNRGGVLRGFNTDIVGVAAALRGVRLKGKSVLLVGAGGAARTVSYILRREGAKIFCHNSDIPQAEALCKDMGCTVLAQNALSSIPFDVIVNATPIGMEPNVDAVPVPENIIRQGAAVFDLVYSPLQTKLLRAARARGAKPISGLVMFLAQGVEQERLWLGRNIDDRGYMALLRKTLQNR